MPRRLRVQYENALYHVINRGNYRLPVFTSIGAARSFERALGEASEMHEWRIHAHAVMRNHFHLALETPQPNLVAGMHWLESTFATRFNRFRSERGHVFQGRYQALVVEDAAALFRVINYIHLNPVAAKLVEACDVANFRWSSLGRLSRGERPSWMVPEVPLRQLSLEDNRGGWMQYINYLIALADDPQEQERQGFDKLTSGWAIGTLGWKRALAREYSHLRLDVGVSAGGVRELNEARWSDALTKALRDCGHAEAHIAQAPPSTPWKIAIAAKLRRETAAPYSWIAQKLNLGNLNTLRSNVRRWELMHHALA
jgi:putative transposase